MVTPRWARRTLAGARSPVRDSSLPAMWSCVMRIARSPRSSAKCDRYRPADRVEQCDRAGRQHARRCARRRCRRPSIRRRSRTRADRAAIPCIGSRRRRLGIDLALVVIVDSEPSTLRLQPRNQSRAGPGDGRHAADVSRPSRTPRRDARGLPRHVPPPARRLRRRPRPHRAGSVVGAYQSGSSVSRPADGSPTQLTIGLRASRTWHVWLQRMHGRIVLRRSSPSLATRSGSAIWARVISTPSHTPSPTAHSAWPQSTTEPCRNTGVVSAAALTARQTRRC